eukprot:CAMPEP_0176104142 /NCGR_PEP_ID=MMETSP0120_2-20121206/52254_1 /TAXON_ID=160619 /ORGANISM="Kryptoperidinium foliaceum, Strain CCMP 1326" /LENGTH=220 /DNA_ID=CAMNT_0017438241 /DNA_START=8 /DNA_END=670 /DNA_ORIENTATION=+
MAVPWDGRRSVCSEGTSLADPFACSGGGADIFGSVSLPSNRGIKNTFQATLNIKLDGPGLMLMEQPGGSLRVRRIHVGGPAFWYNQAAPEDERIMVGDVLTTVDGVSGQPAIMRESLDTTGDVEVTVRRPDTYLVKGLHKGSKILGLCLVRHTRKAALVVKAVQDVGVVASWNMTAGEDTAIAEGDQIVSVNGIAGDVEAMRRMLMDADILDIELQRRAH